MATVDDSIEGRVAAIHVAYEGLWSDFLRNRWPHAEERSEAFLRIIDSLPEALRRTDAELCVVEADFSYILGTIRGNHRLILERALECYDKSLALPMGSRNLNAQRMRAETLMRLHRYADGFTAFGNLANHRSAPWEQLEAAPFRLLHDAALCERLDRLGRLDSTRAAEAAASLRHVAEALKERGSQKGTKRWPCVAQLDPKHAASLRRGLLDELLFTSSPYPPQRLGAWTEEAGADPLNPSVNWAEAEASYASDRITVVDEFFTVDALEELWRYARETACFRTVRRGFLGAFPADGNTHPILLSTARALERRMPLTFAGHPLGLWWLFKYTDEAPQGIGIHADAAAVNVNIWLTPDIVRKEGGGLDIFMQLPPHEANVTDFNHEFPSEAAEAEFRRKLRSAGDVKHIDYKQNRAVIFVSDLFHESEPFTFIDCVEQPRINLTFLFGDRTVGRSSDTAPIAEDAMGASGKRKHVDGTTDDGWDLFE
jgi:hypothetical protein